MILKTQCPQMSAILVRKSKESVNVTTVLKRNVTMIHTNFILAGDWFCAK